MINCNELNCVASNEIIEDDNVVIVKNIEKEDNVVDDNKSQDEVKVNYGSLDDNVVYESFLSVQMYKCILCGLLDYG